MKTLYKVVMFLAIFQIIVFAVGLLGTDNGGSGIFPYTLYDSSDYADIQQNSTDPITTLGHIFLPSGTFSVNIPVINLHIFDFTLNTFTIIGFITLLAIGGAAVAIATRHYATAVLLVFGLVFVPMLTNSIKFFRIMFNSWNVTSVSIIGLALGVAIFILVIIHVMETPTHGRS